MVSASCSLRDERILLPLIASSISMCEITAASRDRLLDRGGHNNNLFGIDRGELWPEAYKLRLFARHAEKRNIVNRAEKSHMIHPGVNRTEGK